MMRQTLRRDHPGGRPDLWPVLLRWHLAANHPAVAQIKAGLKKVAEEKWKGKAGDVYVALKAGDKLCLHDGDSKPQYEGYKGSLFLNASNKIRPLVIDGNKSPLQASSGKPYSGCYVNAVVELWAQANKFGQRINASLMGVQFLRDGQRLSGGGVASADDFQAIPEAEGASEGPATTGGSPDPFA
jgi:hypothetical protein